MLRTLPRRILTGFTILLAAAASVMLAFAIAGPGGRAGAVPDAPSTTGNGCGFVTCTTAPPATTVPVTSPPSTSPPQTAPATTRPSRQTLPRTTTPRTTVPPSTTTTTLPSIGGNLSVTPSTVPFTTKQQSSHVSPVFAALSGAGFFLALLIVALRFWITRPAG